MAKTFVSVKPTADDLLLLDFSIQVWTLPIDGSEPQESTLGPLHSRRVMQPGAAIAMANSIQLSEQGHRIYMFAAISQFFEAMLVPDSWAALLEVMNDPGRKVDAEILVDVMMWMQEEITGRPTGQPST